jgi:predicted nucleic acid-binding Zn finger protein
MSATQVHIAGVGISTSSPQDLNNSAIDAGTKALLDAGITYGKVQLSVACSLGDTQTRIPQACFKAFGRQKAPIGSMDSGSALYMVAQCVRSGQIDCAMLIGLDTVSKHDRKERDMRKDADSAYRDLLREVGSLRRSVRKSDSICVLNLFHGRSADRTCTARRGRCHPCIGSIISISRVSARLRRAHQSL